ncbi:MAG: glycine cleavage system transcriptional repressor [Syntrophales bacterium]
MNIVFTLTGPDRIGIVDEVTRMLLDAGGNVETSRMTRLGGEFAILMLVSIPSEEFAGLGRNIATFAEQGYKVTTGPTSLSYAERFPGWLPCEIEIRGADHEGIVHEIAHILSQRGISIEAMDTGTTRAPISGMPLFMMTAAIIVPPGLAGRDWESELYDAGDRLGVEIKVTAPKKE